MTKKPESLRGKVRRTITQLDNYVDSTTGEIINVETKTITRVVNTNEEFFIIYSEIIGVLHRLASHDTHVLYSIMFKMLIGDGRFESTVGTRNMIKAMLGISLSTISRSIKNLIDAEILIKEGSSKSMYLINPIYCWKGSKDSRNQQFKFLYELSQDIQ